ncbi:MAG: hypothetical protein V8Q27_05135 [Eubacteriales bacterium]
MEALLACGQVDTAELYMRNGWTSKQNTLVYRQLSLNIQAHYAYQDKDAARYRSILEQGGRLLKRSANLGPLDWLEGCREQAVERLQTTPPRVPYEQACSPECSALICERLDRSKRHGNMRIM